MPDQNIALQDTLNRLGPELERVADCHGRRSRQYRDAVRAACLLDDAIHRLGERQPMAVS